MTHRTAKRTLQHAGVYPDFVKSGKDGGPIIFFERDTSNAVVFSPSEQFMAASTAMSSSDYQAGS